MKDTREHHSSALYCALILPHFHEEQYAHCPEFPPAPHSALRIDHGHQYLVKGEKRLRPLLFSENKRAKKFGAAGNRDLEDQVEKYCKTRADHHAKRSKKYPEELELQYLNSAIIAGYHYKFWVYYPVSKVFRPILDNHTHYLDPGKLDDAKLIVSCLDTIKEHPPFQPKAPISQPAEEDHSEYSAGSGEPDDTLLSQITKQGYLPFNLRKMDRDKKSGTVFYHMVNENNKAIVVQGEDWQRKKLIIDGVEVNHFFSFKEEETGKQYYVWRLGELLPKEIPLRPQVVQAGDDSAGDSENQSEASTDIDTEQYSEVFFKAIEKDKDKTVYIRFSRPGKADIRWLETELTRKHVIINGERENCVVFDRNDTQYYCCISATFQRALKEEVKKMKKMKGKGKR